MFEPDTIEFLFDNGLPVPFGSFIYVHFISPHLHGPGDSRQCWLPQKSMCPLGNVVQLFHPA